MTDFAIVLLVIAFGGFTWGLLALSDWLLRGGK